MCCSWKTLTLSTTSHYLPDLLPIQAHDLMLQQHQQETNSLFPANIHTAIGHHMLEGLQPIRKEEMWVAIKGFYSKLDITIMNILWWTSQSVENLNLCSKIGGKIQIYSIVCEVQGNGFTIVIFS